MQNYNTGSRKVPLGNRSRSFPFVPFRSLRSHPVPSRFPLVPLSFPLVPLLFPLIKKNCQIVTPVNRLKRFIYACYYKKYKETYEDVIDGDETTVELRQTKSQNWVKPGNELQEL